MDGRLTWTDCDDAGDYFVPNVLSPGDLVSRPDNMDKTVPHTQPRHKIFEVAPPPGKIATALIFMQLELSYHTTGVILFFR